ncbi:MAG: Crp/Fnr family transcriptional regulator [Candidatus Cohnella colombiensis]|uniref:Crp/Fnr family transcriptional regulator n=1 Tax=Candidatus Cohnella colombiensis TaxID=3121368 RepID=A0AA95F3N0_9BACL|nr:MAG: Crp/Fnr family transcriptional regulator [Cohnella sp.]
MSGTDWEQFRDRSQHKLVEQGSYLVRAGEQVRQVYFCTQGLFRFFYTLVDGKEFNKSFAQAGEVVTSYGAMISGEPSYFSIQALEHSRVIEITYDAIQQLINHSHTWERMLRKSVEQLYLKKEERERQLLFLNAEERLEQFRTKYPGLELRVPQYQIASYLGISPVSLSRISSKARN